MLKIDTGPAAESGQTHGSVTMRNTDSPFDEIKHRHSLNEVGDVAQKVGMTGRFKKGEVESACPPFINLSYPKSFIGQFHSSKNI